jgi:hypothetical protein
MIRISSNNRRISRGSSISFSLSISSHYDLSCVSGNWFISLITVVFSNNIGVIIWLISSTLRIISNSNWSSNCTSWWFFNSSFCKGIITSFNSRISTSHTFTNSLMWTYIFFITLTVIFSSNSSKFRIILIINTLSSQSSIFLVRISITLLISLV